MLQYLKARTIHHPQIQALTQNRWPVANPNYHYALVSFNNRVISVAIYYFKNKIANLVHIETDPEFRRESYAMSLLLWCMVNPFSQRAKAIRYIQQPNSDAKKFFDQCGFKDKSLKMNQLSIQELREKILNSVLIQDARCAISYVAPLKPVRINKNLWVIDLHFLLKIALTSPSQLPTFGAPNMTAGTILKLPIDTEALRAREATLSRVFPNENLENAKQGVHQLLRERFQKDIKEASQLYGKRYFPHQKPAPKSCIDLDLAGLRVFVSAITFFQMTLMFLVAEYQLNQFQQVFTLLDCQRLMLVAEKACDAVPTMQCQDLPSKLLPAELIPDYSGPIALRLFMGIAAALVMLELIRRASTKIRFSCAIGFDVLIQIAIFLDLAAECKHYQKQILDNMVPNLRQFISDLFRIGSCTNQEITHSYSATMISHQIDFTYPFLLIFSMFELLRYGLIFLSNKRDFQLPEKKLSKSEVIECLESNRDFKC